MRCSSVLIHFDEYDSRQFPNEYFLKKFGNRGKSFLHYNMIETLLLIAGSFTAGLFYSKGKPNPVESALHDAKRVAGTVGRKAAKMCSKAISGNQPPTQQP